MATSRSPSPTSICSTWGFAPWSPPSRRSSASLAHPCRPRPRRSNPVPCEGEALLYVYAITDSRRAPAVAGLHGESLRAVGDRGPFAVVSEHESLPQGPSAEDLWAHERVVEELVDGSAVLPMRF